MEYQTVFDYFTLSENGGRETIVLQSRRLTKTDWISVILTRARAVFVRTAP